MQRPPYVQQIRTPDCDGTHASKPDIDSLVLDGIPRNIDQTTLMDKMIHIKNIFHLSCADHRQIVVRPNKAMLGKAEVTCDTQQTFF